MPPARRWRAVQAQLPISATMTALAAGFICAQTLAQANNSPEPRPSLAWPQLARVTCGKRNARRLLRPTGASSWGPSATAPTPGARASLTLARVPSSRGGRRARNRVACGAAAASYQLWLRPASRLERAGAAGSRGRSVARADVCGSGERTVAAAERTSGPPAAPAPKRRNGHAV